MVVLMQIVVPASDLLVYHANMGADGGISHAMLNMANLESALQGKTAPIGFIEEESYEDLHEPSEMKIITFSSHQDGVRKIQEAVRYHYKRE